MSRQSWPGRHAGDGDGLEHGVGEVGHGQLAGADVAGDEERRERRVGGGPRHRLPAGLLEHPAADGHDEPGLLEQRQEVVREQHAGVGRAGVLPAQQRLDPDQLAGVDPQDRLVVQEELVVVERRLEAGLVDPGAVAAPPRLVVHDVAGRAHVPGVHQGLVGVTDEVGDVAGRVAADGQAQVARERQRRVAGDDVVGRGRPGRGWRGRSAPSRSCCRRPGTRARTRRRRSAGPGPAEVGQAARHLGEDGVAGVGAEAVVDVAERVEVDEGQDAVAARGPAGHRPPS